MNCAIFILNLFYEIQILISALIYFDKNKLNASSWYSPKTRFNILVCHPTVCQMYGKLVKHYIGGNNVYKNWQNKNQIISSEMCLLNVFKVVKIYLPCSRHRSRRVLWIIRSWNRYHLVPCIPLLFVSY
jgi:hypothetical protein